LTAGLCASEHSIRAEAMSLPTARQADRAFCPALRASRRFSRYSLITQMIHTAACDRHHSVEQQPCRRLKKELSRLLSDVQYRQGVSAAVR